MSSGEAIAAVFFALPLTVWVWREQIISMIAEAMVRGIELDRRRNGQKRVEDAPRTEER